MQNKGQIKKRIKEIEREIRYEEGMMAAYEDCKNEPLANAARYRIRQSNVVIATLKEVLQ